MYFFRWSSLRLIDVVGAQRIMRRDDKADRRVYAREFFDNDRIIDVAKPRAAEVFRENRAHDSPVHHIF